MNRDPIQDTFRAHMRRAGELVAERRLPEAEGELLRALGLVRSDLRARKLLGLIRFRLGRLIEADEVLREVATESPDDGTVHLNIGLIALKLERFASAAESLNRAIALRPDDRRALGYLGYTYARLGDTDRAAQALRAAGQDLLAAEVEAAPPGEALSRPPSGVGPTPSEIRDEFSGGRTAVTRVEGLEARPSSRARSSLEVAVVAPRAPRSVAALSLDAFALDRLVAAEQGASLAEWDADGLSVRVNDELYARADVLAVVDGGLRLAPAHRRSRGRTTDEPLGAGPSAFCMCVGAGEVWLHPPSPGGSLLELRLEEDILYLHEELVAAFTGELVWEAGSVPRADLPLIQFRGSGRVVVEIAGRDVIAVRTHELRVLRVDPARLVGWIGRVVVRGLTEEEGLGSQSHVACEGEGVLLLSRHRHGQARQRVHQRAEPRDHGAGAPGSGGAAADR